MDRHARHAHVAERHKLLLDLDRIELAAQRQPEYPLAQVVGRRHRREQGAQRGDHDIDLLRGGNQLGEHAGAFAEHRRQRRRAGVGQQPPPREPPDPVAPAHRGRRGRGDADWTPAPDHGARYGRGADGGRCRGQRCYDRRRPRSSAGRRLPAARQRLRGQAQVAGQQVGFLLGRRHHHQRPASGLPQPVQQQRRETALHPLYRRRQHTAGNPPQQLPRRLRRGTRRRTSRASWMPPGGGGGARRSATRRRLRCLLMAGIRAMPIGERLGGGVIHQLACHQRNRAGSQQRPRADAQPNLPSRRHAVQRADVRQVRQVRRRRRRSGRRFGKRVLHLDACIALTGVQIL